jgi:putative hydrolase of the HAD superfamily
MDKAKKLNLRVVVFDLDNTLYSYREIHESALYAALNLVSQRLSIPIDKILGEYEVSRLQSKLTLANTASSHNRYIYFINICRKLKLDFQEAETMHNEYWNAYLLNIKLKPGIDQLLNRLKNKNIKIYILSDFMIEYTFKKLIALNILHYFNDIISSEEVGKEKPSKKSFETVLKMSEVNSENILMVGDDIKKDILGALNHKMNAAYVGNEIININKSLFYSFPSFQKLEKFIFENI